MEGAHFCAGPRPICTIDSGGCCGLGTDFEVDSLERPKGPARIGVSNPSIDSGLIGLASTNLDAPSSLLLKVHESCRISAGSKLVEMRVCKLLSGSLCSIMKALVNTQFSTLQTRLCFVFLVNPFVADYFFRKSKFIDSLL